MMKFLSLISTPVMKGWRFSFGWMMVFLASGSLSAQDPVLKRISDAVTGYAGKVLEEKVYVHTDQSGYQAGEMMWFSVYNVDGRQNRPLSLSTVAYIELLDNQNKALLQTKVALDSGFGNGTLIIPAGIPSGVYRLKCYTRWMKNFSENSFFSKYITIINARRALPPPLSHPEQQFTLRFFPEGGNLVGGLTSRLAFKITDRYGNGVSGAGYILTENQDTLTRFETEKFGMGSFMFTPEKGKKYSAFFTDNDGNITSSQLPIAYDEGYVMQVSPANAAFTISVRTNKKDAAKVYLLIHTRLSLKLALAGSFTDGITHFNVDGHMLGEGVSVITLFDAAGNPVCERLYFRQPEKQGELSVNPEREIYQPREKVNLDLQSTLPGSSHISMAVYRLDSLQGMEQGNIQSYLWLQSELRGKIESPGYYFEKADEARRRTTDHLLLTQGWRRYDWKKLYSGKEPVFSYEPEYNGIILHARVIDTRDGRPGAGVQAFAGAPGIYSRFTTARSNDSGYLKVEMPELFGTSELVVQTQSQNQDSIYRVDVMTPWCETHIHDTLSLAEIAAKDTSDILAQHIAAQVQYIYSEDKINRFDTLAIDTSAFYRQADLQYILDDYTRFTTMEEVLREYIRWMLVQKRDNNYYLLIYDKERKRMMDNTPLVLLDGIPVMNLNKLLQYDPLKVRKLEIVNNRYVIGDYVFNGILSFTTYQGNLENYPLDKNAVVVDYEGLQVQREFYSPEYEPQTGEASTIPDFRTLLYWKNHIRLKNNLPQKLSFYTSDIKGVYKIVLEGISNEGHTSAAMATFIVR